MLNPTEASTAILSRIEDVIATIYRRGRIKLFIDRVPGSDPQ
jgi:hypothetical protein